MAASDNNADAKPTISIITVCRNSAETIGRTIESVFRQEGLVSEYIVVDGNSTDGTQEIVRSFGDKVSRFISEQDEGISDAFNKGILLATGEIIGLINSDDMFLPSALGTVVDLFQQHPETEVLHDDLLLYRDDRLIKRITPAGRWWYPWRLVLFNHPATFVRREVYEKYGKFNPAFRVAMDVEIFLRWIKHGVLIKYIPVPLVRMQAGGISCSQADAGYREVKNAFLLSGYSPLLIYFLFIAKLVVHKVGILQVSFKSRLRI